MRPFRNKSRVTNAYFLQKVKLLESTVTLVISFPKYLPVQLNQSSFALMLASPSKDTSSTLEANFSFSLIVK
jgi:hypothetical protein